MGNKWSVTNSTNIPVDILQVLVAWPFPAKVYTLDPNQTDSFNSGGYATNGFYAFIRGTNTLIAAYENVTTTPNYRGNYGSYNANNIQFSPELQVAYNNSIITQGTPMGPIGNQTGVAYGTALQNCMGKNKFLFPGFANASSPPLDAGGIITLNSPTSTSSTYNFSGLENAYAPFVNIQDENMTTLYTYNFFAGQVPPNQCTT